MDTHGECDHVLYELLSCVSTHFPHLSPTRMLSCMNDMRRTITSLQASRVVSRSPPLKNRPPLISAVGDDEMQTLTCVDVGCIGAVGDDELAVFVDMGCVAYDETLNLTLVDVGRGLQEPTLVATKGTRTDTRYTSVTTDNARHKRDGKTKRRDKTHNTRRQLSQM